MKRTSSAGFTLIELLVVIGILGVLAAALLPAVLESRRSADVFADKKNLEWHYSALEMYKNRQRPRWPADGGHKFVLTPWVKGVVDKTAENRDRYFTPSLQQYDARYAELRDMDPKDIWRDFDELNSDDTEYAGLSAKHYPSMRSGDSAIMANDNEQGPAFQDGTINVLMANGAVRTLYKADELKEYWNEDDPNFVFEVGPNSPMPLLRTLRY